MRLFIALLMQKQAVQKLLDIQNVLRSAAVRGRYTPPENLHLTLAFLGEQPPARVEAACRAMRRTPLRPLQLRFDHTGCFRRSSGEVWWAGLAENPALQAMQAELCRHLAAEGFVLESRRFLPHVTLARDVRMPGGPGAKERLSQPFSAPADALCLLCSERIGGRLVYTEQFLVRAQEGEPV